MHAVRRTEVRSSSGGLSPRWTRTCSSRRKIWHRQIPTALPLRCDVRPTTLRPGGKVLQLLLHLTLRAEIARHTRLPGWYPIFATPTGCPSPRCPLLPQPLLLLLQAMQKVNDDIPNPRQELVQASLARFLTQRLFQDPAKQVGYGAQVVGFHADSAECSTRYVELVAQPDVDVADFALGGRAAGPLR